MPWDRNQMAERAAKELEDGFYVNLGIGMPTEVANHVPADREVIYHSENGVLGFGAAPAPGEEDPQLINASKQHITMRPGGSFFHHADSFGMMRGGHIDISVLGAYLVAANGDLANHVLDIMLAFDKSSKSGAKYELTTTCDQPAALPLGLSEGFLDA